MPVITLDDSLVMVSDETMAESVEYRCNNCGQLRLYMKGGHPGRCGNCGSKDIITGKPGTLPV